jgi:hypothetical protein
MVARMARRKTLSITRVFAPTRSSSLQLQSAYEAVMPEVEYVGAVESRSTVSREREVRAREERGGAR